MSGLYLASPFDIFKPIHSLWWNLFGVTLESGLSFVYAHVVNIPFFDLIGPYGVAIVILTIIIRLILSPLQQFQLVNQRKTMAEQRKLAPQMAELSKKYKKDPQRLNTERMKLMQEHGVNPYGMLFGCLPLLVQLPILTALYYVFTGFAKGNRVIPHFLFVPNLNDNPLHHVAFSFGGFGIPVLAYLVFPLLAALTTLIQSRMLQMPPSPNPTDQEAQTQQMQRTMLWISPLMIGYFALNVPAGLGLYWFVGNLASIIQQSFVVGWGQVLPARFRNTAPAAPSTPPPKSASNGQKGLPQSRKGLAPPPPKAAPPPAQGKSKKPNNRPRSDLN
jgi:YidC/Oxa1 family membrane protein insertase